MFAGYLSHPCFQHFLKVEVSEEESVGIITALKEVLCRSQIIGGSGEPILDDFCDIHLILHPRMLTCTDSIGPPLCSSHPFVASL